MRGTQESYKYLAEEAAVLHARPPKVLWLLLGATSGLHALLELARLPEAS